MKALFLLLLLVSTPVWANKYPAHWWQHVPDTQRQGSWEILPHEAKPGEVILSKRNELGVFSNLGHSPFHFEGKHYASIEALWQMMKYPDLTDRKDPRIAYAHEYPYTRLEVYELDGFTAKRAGDAANKINKKYSFDFVSYKRVHFNYKDLASGSDRHYKIIKQAIKEKVLQNPRIMQLLLKTKGLVLKPDHSIRENSPKSYYYNKILMDIRDGLN